MDFSVKAWFNSSKKGERIKLIFYKEMNWKVIVL